MSPTLIDPTADRSLAEHGYAVIDAISRAHAEELRQAYWQIAPPGEQGMVVDYMRRDRTVARAAFDLLSPQFEEYLAPLLVDHRLVMATFVVKHPGGHESRMFLHDDRTFVDERRHRSATLWIPLVDVGPEIPNGGLAVVPGSHRLPTGAAGTFTPDLIRPFEAHLTAMSVLPALSAGQALVYDSRVLHVSGENRTDRPREALACTVVPRDAELLHWVATGRRGRRVHAIDETFFTDHHLRDLEQHMPEQFPVITRCHQDPDLSPEDVVQALGGEAPVPRAVTPGDLYDHGGPADPPEPRWHPAPTVWARTDLEVAAADLRPPHSGRSGVTLGVVSGEATLTAARARSVRAVADITARAVVPRRAIATDVLVLDAGGRATLSVPGRGPWRWHLTVAECPTLGSGVRTGDATMNLRLDRRVELAPGDATLWNEGPGALAVLITRSPGRPRPRTERRAPSAQDEVGTTPDSPRPRRRPGLPTRARVTAWAERSLGALLAADERLVNKVDPPVDGPLDAFEPPWARGIADSWPLVREELDALIAAEVRLPDTDELVGVGQGAEGSWTTFVMAWYGRWIEDNCDRCPRTAALLRDIPGVQVAGYTVLGPDTHIPRHQGPAKSFRWQMGVRVPAPAGSCRLQIGDEVVTWADGRCLAFDDRTPHEAWNDSSEARYVLFVQVAWPIDGWQAIPHRLTHRVFGRATRRIGERAERLARPISPRRDPGGEARVPGT